MLTAAKGADAGETICPTRCYPRKKGVQATPVALEPATEPATAGVTAHSSDAPDQATPLLWEQAEPAPDGASRPAAAAASMSRRSPTRNADGRTAEDSSKKTRRRPRLLKTRFLAITAGLAVLAGVSMVFGMMMAVASELPRLEDRQQYKVAKASIVYDSQGREITRLRNNQNRILVSSQRISPVMKQAIVSIEDRRFYDHPGVDIRGIGRALVADAVGGRIKQGASTITQQFVKNALEKANQRTVMEKLREVALAYHLEKQWTKDKILTEYLNAIYFGNGAYGIESAARTYFAKAHPGCEPNCAQKLLPWEAAMLAGVIASPSLYDPLVYPANATDRRNRVLTNMYDQGFITRDILDRGRLEAVPTADEITRPTEDSKAPYFSTWLRQQLVDRYGAGTTFGGGLRIHTTLDLDLQAAASAAVHSQLSGKGPSAALVAIENKTGRIRAMYGGDDYENRPFNLATQGKRQPGSSFKPFTLISVLRKGYGLGSNWKSAEIGKEGSGTLIKNYDDAYAGIISLRDATASSDNTAFVRMGWNAGINTVARQAKAMGVKTQISRNSAMILGGLREGVTPLEMAYAYTSIANTGRRPDGKLAPGPGSPVAIEKVLQNGRTYRKQRDRTRYERVFPAQVGYDAQEALRAVVSSGTGKAADPGYWVAGKTGTTENYGDAWFVGFSKELSVAIWVGFPDKTVPMLDQYNGEPVAGGTFPAAIFRHFMMQAQKIEQARAEGRKGPTDLVTGESGPVDTGAASTEAQTPDQGTETPQGTDRPATETPQRPPQRPPADQDRTPATPPRNDPPPAPAPDPGGGDGAGGGAAPGT